MDQWPVVERDGLTLDLSLESCMYSAKQLSWSM